MNREKLAQLIYWKRSFTEDELIRRINVRPKADTGPHPLREYLEGLKKLGVLAFDGGRYTLLNPAKERTAAA